MHTPSDGAGDSANNYTYRSQAEQSLHNTTMASVLSPDRTTASNANRTRMSPQALRDQESEIAQLNKQLFNMKLRVFYLEERLAKAGRPGGDDYSELVKQNLDQVRCECIVECVDMDATPQVNCRRMVCPCPPR